VLFYQVFATILFDKSVEPDDNNRLLLPELGSVSFARTRLSRSVYYFCSAMAVLCLLHGASFAQNTPEETTQPIEAAGGFLQSQGAQPKFESASKLSSDARAAMKEGRVFSVPHFSGSFAWQGNAYPYTMVGSKPQMGGTTEVPTQIVPISLFFEEFVDESGSPLVLDPGPVLPRVQSSPNFHNALYATGLTQFADAVQRAQFNRSAGPEWHTLLGQPVILRPVRIAVPRGAARVYRNRSSGVMYAIVDTNFFISQLNTIIQLENLQPDALAIALTANVFLSPQSDIKKCCVLGFHTSFDVGELAQVKFVQTFIWASWVDPGILGPSLADVTPMSHEISEWMNNPFGSNSVPAWQVPNSNACQSNLETGDPLATMPNAGYPVPIDGFTYHPQNQVLMQWFQRGSSSDAIEGAFSFPDQTLMTAPSQACGAR
jgi:chitinase